MSKIEGIFCDDRVWKNYRSVGETSEMSSTLNVVLFPCSGDGASNIYFKILRKQSKFLCSYWYCIVQCHFEVYVVVEGGYEHEGQSFVKLQVC